MLHEGKMKMAESLKSEKKREMAKGQEKAKEKGKIKNKGRRPMKKKCKHKVLKYAKGIRVKRKMREAQSV